MFYNNVSLNKPNRFESIKTFQPGDLPPLGVPDMPPQNSGIMPETLDSEFFIPGYLLTQIGKTIKVDFIVGNSVTERSGVLSKVGVNYIMLDQPNNNKIIADLTSIIFITIIGG